MMLLPSGISVPKLVRVKLQPMPNITSELSRYWRTASGIASPHEPRERG